MEAVPSLSVNAVGVDTLGLQGFHCRFEDSYEVYVRVKPGPQPLALFLPGSGARDRCGGFFKHFWKLLEDEYSIIAVDFPGQGLAGTSPLPTRSGREGPIVVSVLQACGASSQRPAVVFADTGGCNAFFQAYSLSAELFAGHHVLINAIVGDVLDGVSKQMERDGTDLLTIFADGWGPDDAYIFTVPNCGKVFDLFKASPDRCEFWMCKVAVSTGPMCISSSSAMFPPDFLMGEACAVAGVAGKWPKYYCLKPNEECEKLLLEYLHKKRREAIREGGPTAPTLSAIEMGVVNDTFRVFVRIRPMLARETTAKSVNCTIVSDVENFPQTPPPQRIALIDPEKRGLPGLRDIGSQRGEFVFDRVFVEAGQDEIFAMVGQPLVDAALKGSNVTMFAYGQTGTGKTFTMEGPVGNEGLIYHTIHRLFAGLENKEIQYQYVQLYNTDFTDLLHPESRAKLTIEDAGTFMSVKHATWAVASNADDLLARVSTGASFRASGATNMNDASSRSHAILLLNLPQNGAAVYMVDLAGSERIKRSGATGMRFEEATSINQALSSLGRVVTNLVSNDGKREGHIPYLDNPLTHLLKSSIGGASKTALVCCITSASDSLDESNSTLRFAVQASHVRNKVNAKEARDDVAAAAAAIEDSGQPVILDESGLGEIPLPMGKLIVHGCWCTSGPIALCIHGVAADGSAFKPFIRALNGSIRILAPDLNIKSCRLEDLDCVFEKILALMDFIGAAKTVLVGRDFGSAAAIKFKLQHPKRVGRLFLENVADKLDEKTYKQMQATNGGQMMQSMKDWAIAYDMFGDAANPTKAVKGLKGKVTLLWPLQSAGRPDPQMRGKWGAGFAGQVAKALKTHVIDTYSFTEADSANELLKVVHA